MNKLLIPFLSALPFCFIVSCNQNTSQTQKEENHLDTIVVTPSESENNNLFVIDSLLDYNATLLAAMDSSGLSDSTARKAYFKLNRIWEYKTQKTLAPISQWVKDEKLQFDSGKNGLVFYPFSGPDFEFANVFYPEADEYILCGLEPAGNDSALIFQKPMVADSFLIQAENYFFYSNRFGFFRTLDMEQQFKKRGVIDVIAFYLKRTGVKIGAVETYHWNNGMLNQADTAHQSNVCHFQFQYPSGKISELYYFSKDLSNAGMNADSTWLQWVKKQSAGKQLVSLTKSASYLMHTPYFSVVRNFILDNASLHIQDDSGIDFDHMKKTGRTVKLYGTYSRVIPLFKNKFQPTLKEAYQTDSLAVKPLPFQIGYNLKVGESNLQVLEK